MKALPLLLAASVVANAALVSAVVFRNDSPASAAAAAATPAPLAAGKTAPLAPGQMPTATQIVASLNADSAEQMRAVLTAAGFDDELVRLLVGRRIRQRFAARRDALNAAQQADEADWWKDYNDYYAPERRELRERQRELNDEINTEIERVLGPAAPREPSSWERRRYGDLSPEKLKELRLIENDYQELIGVINAEARDFRLPEDAEKIRFLNEEKLRDLAAVLSPAELEAYRLRNSSTSGQLRTAMSRMDASEEEYRRVHELRREFDEQFNTNTYNGGVSNPGPEFWTARSEAESRMEAQLKLALGPERYLDFKRAQDHGYRQLQGAAERFGLPADTPVRAYALRQTIPAQALLIADDAKLDSAAKREALRALAARAREQVTALYGADLIEPLLKTEGLRWIEQLERGQISTYDETGRQTGSRHVNVR